MQAKHARSRLCAYPIISAAVAVCATARQEATAADTPQRPNFVVIMSDDIGYSDIGAYGGEIRTPTLDRLAAEGRQFTQFYNTARCCPSRASLLTGLYPHQAGIGHLIYNTPHPGYGDFLAPDSSTVAEALRASGYGTYMVGKWHMAPRSYNAATDAAHWPTRRGFDKFYGTIAGSGSFFDPSTLCRMETFITPDNDPEYRPERFYYTDAITDNAVQFLRQHTRERADAPFFLYVAYTAAHWPLHAPEESIEPYRGRYDAGYEAIHRDRVERLRAAGLLPEIGAIADPVGRWADVEHPRAEASLMEAYAAMITHMDAGIATLIDALRELGHLDNTMIIYVQDNGGCAEDWFSDELTITGALQPLAPDQLQTRALPPMQTRDGRPVRAGGNVIAGPEDSYTGYKEAWANVSNTPFRWYKHYVHEGGISTPFIAWWPAGFGRDPGRIVRDPAHLIDIAPTLLDYAGVPFPAERAGVALQPPAGVSLRPVLSGDGRLDRAEPLFWEHESNRAVRDGQWKLVALENQPWELYDISVDRGEMFNLAYKHPERVNRMAAQWDAWAAANRVLPLGGWRDQGGADDPAAHPARVTLRQGDKLPGGQSPYLAAGGVCVSAEITAGEITGVIAAQGGRSHGFSLYAEDGAIVFAVRRNRDLYKLAIGDLPPPPFTVAAALEKDGMVWVRAGERTVRAGSYWGPFISHPAAGISIGSDSQGISRYRDNRPFAGQLGAVVIEARR
jgi:arylsulfatase